MSLEPNARRRLHLVYVTTRDPQLLTDLRQVFENDQMSFVPSADLLRDIALCTVCTQDAPRRGRAGLCDAHRARWNLEACMAATCTAPDPQESLQQLVHRLLGSSDGGTQFFVAYERQRRALRMVWEAHSRGAVQLPESIVSVVEKAYTSGPRFLPGKPRSTVQQAS